MLLQKIDALSLALNYVDYYQSINERSYMGQYYIFLLVHFHHEVHQDELKALIPSQLPSSKTFVYKCLDELSRAGLAEKITYVGNGRKRVKYCLSSEGNELIARSVADKSVAAPSINPIALCEQMLIQSGIYGVRHQAILLLIYRVLTFDRSNIDQVASLISQNSVAIIQRFDKTTLLNHSLLALYKGGLLESYFTESANGLQKTYYLADQAKHIIRAALHKGKPFNYTLPQQFASSAVYETREPIDEGRVDFFIAALNYLNVSQSQNKAAPLLNYIIMVLVARSGTIEPTTLLEQLTALKLAPSVAGLKGRFRNMRGLKLLEKIKSSDESLPSYLALGEVGQRLFQPSEANDVAPVYLNVDLVALSLQWLTSGEVGKSCSRLIHLIPALILYYHPGSTIEQINTVVSGNGFSRNVYQGMYTSGLVVPALSNNSSKTPGGYCLTSKSEALIKSYLVDGGAKNSASVSIFDYAQSHPQLILNHTEEA